MMAWMLRTGQGPAHPISGTRPGMAVPEGVGRARGRKVCRVPGVLGGVAALLALACGVGVAHGAEGAVSAAAGAHGASTPGSQAQAQVPRQGGGGDPSRTDDVAAAGGSSWRRVAGVFSPPGSFVPSDALTYDTRLVPAGARIEVTQLAGPSATRVGVRLRGLVPRRAYGMHVHTSPCGADPVAAGPHYQHRPAATADPDNEVWLDFRTDEAGDGRAEALHDWGFREGGARSVVIHDRQGGAGERVACFTVPFGPPGPVE
ncbi:superoxide dismutase family protein [Streptomyces sp. NPDC006267]|uniref:superoxide dismutase family protein n=1 Tax=Streptomyces sp. NPDC006267 TaxID=3157173 RepID=UPI0033B4B0A8